MKLLILPALVAAVSVFTFSCNQPTAKTETTTEKSESTTFAGDIKLDVRDSKPDWKPFLRKKAPEGAPNILFILYDDTGWPHGRHMVEE